MTDSNRLDILRYLSSLKNPESIGRNVARTIHFLLGKERFAGRVPAGRNSERGVGAHSD